MTPHPHPHPLVRRALAFAAAAALLAGAPAVAFALSEDDTGDGPAARRLPPVPSTAVLPLPDDEVPSLPDTFGSSSLPDLGPDGDGAAEPEVGLTAPPADDPAQRVPVIDEDPVELALSFVAAVLTDTYTWDERSERVTALQQVLGVTVDGWYAHATRRAHRSALEAAGMPTDHVPPAPATNSTNGPSARQWAALRHCESTGNYSATNPSGKYRGAYQFDRPTWDGVARRNHPHLVGVDPAAASPGDQDAMARALYRERGAQPWPVCGRHLR